MIPGNGLVFWVAHDVQNLKQRHIRRMEITLRENFIDISDVAGNDV